MGFIGGVNRQKKSFYGNNVWAKCQMSMQDKGGAVVLTSWQGKLIYVCVKLGCGSTRLLRFHSPCRVVSCEFLSFGWYCAGSLDEGQ